MRPLGLSFFVLAFALGELAGAAFAEPPELVLDGRSPPGRRLVVPLDLANGGHPISAVVFSLDFQPDRIYLDGADADGDGVPDAVRFPNGEPQIVFVDWDRADSDGELDVLLANLSGLPFLEGTLMEFELRARQRVRPASVIRFSSNPAASFGNNLGQNVPGTTRVLGTDLFADGFESGDLSRWSRTLP